MSIIEAIYRLYSKSPEEVAAWMLVLRIDTQLERRR